MIRVRVSADIFLTMTQDDSFNITGHLAGCDDKLARLIKKIGSPKIEKLASDPFAALVRSITSQQLNGDAAKTIFNRLKESADNNISPATLSRLSHETLSALGLSRAKASCILELAQKTAEGTIDVTPENLMLQSDEEIIKNLCVVKGIGPWTVHMLLLFQLQRKDVWPVTDFGVRKGYGLAWQTEMPTAKQLEAIGDKFKPYRSLVAWYCWRAIDLKDDPDYIV